jgi:hypothetical protein
MSNALWLWRWNSLKYNQTAEPNTNEQPALNEAVPKVFLLLPYRSMATGCRSVLCYFLVTHCLHFSCNEEKTRNFYQSRGPHRATELSQRKAASYFIISTNKQFLNKQTLLRAISDSQLPYLQSNH